MATILPSTLPCRSSPTFSSHNIPLMCSNPSVLLFSERASLSRCFAKKKVSFIDQILDYIEGGPKLRKWYGAPELLPKDGSSMQDDDDEFSEDEARDAVLVTDGDSEIGQMVILQLIVRRARIKAFVKDKRAALEAYGTYIEPMAGDTSNKVFIKKSLRGVRAIICTNEGFLSNVESLKGVKHIVLLSQVSTCLKFSDVAILELLNDCGSTRLQLSAYKSSSGIQSLMKNNAKKLAEQDESTIVASGIPFTIIRVGTLQNTPGGTQGFSFEKGSAEKGSLSKEDAASICVEALDLVPETGFSFEVVNGIEKVTDWKERLARLMEKAGQ